MYISVEEAKRLVGKGMAHMTSVPKRIPSDTTVDAPLLGNGDLGAAIAGDGRKQVFYLGKNDFWTQAHLGETWQQRKERLLYKEGRRTGTRILAAGWLEIAIPQLEGCSYNAVQDPFLAEVRADYSIDGASARYTSFICAAQNTLVVEIENTGSEKLSVNFCTMPGIYSTAEIYGYADGIREDTVWTEYPAEPQNLPGGRWVFTGVTTDVSAVYTPEKMVRKGGHFDLKPGEKAHILLTMLSDLDSPDAKEETHRLTLLSKLEYKKLREVHRKWWEDYWVRSLVETGDDTLDGFYYASLYIIGSATRKGRVPPGLFGPWITTDRSKWTGSYTLNYNYQSPFFCLYTSNRHGLASSYIDPLIDIIPVGRLYAKEKFSRPGICLPIEIGPWGTVCSSIFHHQKTNAAYCCCNIFMHYFSTRDEEWGRKAYPFVREVADFWEADVVWEDDHYSIIGDSLHEEYYCDKGEKNNTHALGLVRMVLKGIIRMSIELGLDEERSEKWQYVLDHLAPFPVFERNNKKVFRFNEDSYAWRERSNGTSIKMIYPFNCIGLESEPSILEIALNTVEQKDLFDNGNAFCEYTVMCARVGRDPKLLYDKLLEQCALRSMPNKYIWHGGGGIEDCSGVTSGINEMMLQSHEDIIRIFPAWVSGVNAAFKNLRAYGAFTVSASITKDHVDFVQIESEKGQKLTIDLPWERTSVRINGDEAFVISEKRKVFNTKAGDVFYLTDGA